MSSDYVTGRAAHSAFNASRLEMELREYAVKREFAPAFELLQTLFEYHSDNALMKCNTPLKDERLGLERAIKVLKSIRGES